MSAKTENIVVEASGIGFTSNHRTLLQSVSLKIRKGEVFVITGPSGSGKTTLAKIIGSEVKPTQGELIFAKNLKTEMVQQQDQFILATGLRTTYYGQRYENPNEESIPTVADYFEGAVSGFHKNKLNGIAGELEIETLLQRKLLSLSNGERRRVQLALALLRSPDLLILDQPFVGLDVHTRGKIGQLISDLRNTGTAFVIVADPVHIPDFADTVFELNEGTVVRVVPGKGYSASEIRETEKFEIVNQEIFRELSVQKQEYRFAVRMKNVNVSFGGKQVLRNINWEVKSGEQWVLKGHNGAGKTTLLSLVTADNPQGYTNDLILFDRKRGSGESIWDIKRKIGFVSPELHLYFLRKKSIYQPAPGAQINYNSLTCLDVVLSGLNDEIGFNTSVTERSLRLGKQWLERLKMEYLEKSPFLHSSLGEQRIILLARALIKLPDLLILDEPCQGLDPSQTGRFIRLLDFICENGKTTMIYVSHRAEEIPACVSHFLELENGEIKGMGRFS